MSDHDDVVGDHRCLALLREEFSQELRDELRRIVREEQDSLREHIDSWGEDLRQLLLRVVQEDLREALRRAVREEQAPLREHLDGRGDELRKALGRALREERGCLLEQFDGRSGALREGMQALQEEQGRLRERVDGAGRLQQQLLEEHGIYLQKLLEQRGLLQNRGFAPSHDGFQDAPSAGQEHSTPTETPQASKQRPAWQPDAGREPAPPGGFRLREQLEGILPQATPRTSRSEGQFSDMPESENSLGRPEESFHPMQACGDFEGLEVCHSKSSAADSDSDDSTRETAREEWARHLKQSVTQNLGRRARPRMRRSRSSAWMPARYLLLLHPSERLVKVVESPTFQAGCASIIVVNSLWIGYTANVGMTNSLLTPPVPDPAWHEDVSTVFLVVYVIEMAFRLFAYRRSFFVGSAWKWNALDSLLVLAAISEALVQSVDLGSLRIMRGLRMARVLRILRVMRVFRDLRLMAFSIMQSLSSLSWALLLLLIIMYLFGVIFMQGVILHLRGGEEVEFAFIRQGAQTWFNSIFTTMYTLLAGITGGVNWVDVVQPLAEISVAYQVLYVVYTVFVVIGVLNVLTGIFVERASELNDLDRDLVIASQMRRNEAFLVEMKRIFEEADADGSGSICWEEFKKYLQDDRVKAYLATQQLDAFDARLFFDILTEGKSDELTIEDFLVGCQRLKGMARSVELVAVLQETRAMHRRLKVVSRALGAVGHGASRAPTMELRRVGSMSSLASARSSSASKGSSIFA